MEMIDLSKVKINEITTVKRELREETGLDLIKIDFKKTKLLKIQRLFSN